MRCLFDILNIEIMAIKCVNTNKINKISFLEKSKIILEKVQNMAKILEIVGNFTFLNG